MDSHTQMRLYDTSYTGLEADKWRFSITFCDTPPISPCWLPITVCTVICTQMTPRFTAGPQRLMSACSEPTSRSASSTSRVGRPAIGCSWTHRRRSLFGALLHAVAITFPMETYRSAMAQFIQSSQPETSVCTSTVAWRWGLTSIMYCRHATAHWDRSDPSCRLCHHTRLTLSLLLWFTAG